MSELDPNRVSVIATVFNEAATIEELVAALMSQTFEPDEIVICDAGSTDGTREKLEEMASKLPSLRVVTAPGNRSAGRNAAIAASTGTIIAATDAGGRPEPTWLEELTKPFASQASFVGGFYRPEGRSALSTCIGLVMVYVREEAEEGGFLPSARSVAFLRSVWQAVGGFPEEVEFAEDTLFMQRILEAGFELVPALDAVVVWNPPDSLRTLAITSFRWGRGDGLAGLRGWIFKRLALIYGVAPVVLGSLGFLTPAATLLALAPPLADSVRRTRLKYRHAPMPAAIWLIPMCHLVSTYASLAGFLTGWMSRRRA